MFTKEIYTTLLQAYDFFNNRLFGGELSPILITLQRKRGARGYFSPDCFMTRDDESADIHEIALNPETFVDRTDKEILSTLVHEMVHQWQQENGMKPPKRASHNAEWADKMVEVGLMPTATGAEGGPRTGVKITHFIMPGEAFDKLADELLESGCLLPLQAKVRLKAAAAEKDKSKTPYQCSMCGTKIWAKPGVKVICGNCEIEFESTQSEGEK